MNIIAKLGFSLKLLKKLGSMKKLLFGLICLAFMVSALAMDSTVAIDSPEQKKESTELQKMAPSLHTLLIINEEIQDGSKQMIQENREHRVPILIDKKSFCKLKLSSRDWTFYDVDQHYNLAVPQIMIDGLSNLTDSDRAKELGLKLDTLKQLSTEPSSKSKPAAVVPDEHSAGDPANASTSCVHLFRGKLEEWEHADYGLEQILSSNFLPAEREKIQQLEKSYKDIGDLDLVKALSACLITCDDEQCNTQKKIPWHIILFGHGRIISSSNYSGQLPIVAGLNLHQFKRFLQFLETKLATLTLTYTSCFCGGPNHIYPFEDDGTFKSYNYFIISLGLSEVLVPNANKDYIDLSTMVVKLNQVREKWNEIKLSAETFSNRNRELLDLLQKACTFIGNETIATVMRPCMAPFIRLIHQNNFLPLDLIMQIEPEQMHEWPSAVIIDLINGQLRHACFGLNIDGLTLSGSLGIVRLAVPKIDANNKIIGHQYSESIDRVWLKNSTVEGAGNFLMPYFIPQVTGGPIHIGKLLCLDDFFSDVTISFSIDKHAAESHDRHQEKNAAAIRKLFEALINGANNEAQDELTRHALHLANRCLKQTFKDADLLKAVYPRFVEMKLQAANKKRICYYGRKQAPLKALGEKAARLTAKNCLDQFKQQLEAYKNCSRKEFAEKAISLLSKLIEEVSTAEKTYFIDDLQFPTFKIKTS